MALTANCHRDPSGKVYSPRDFDPTVKTVPIAVPITFLRSLFVPEPKKNADGGFVGTPAKEA